MVKNPSFTRSIGGSHGSAPIKSTSINRSQAGGSAVGGYGKPATGMSGSAKGRVAPEYGAAGGSPIAAKRPANACNEQKMSKKPPNGGRM